MLLESRPSGCFWGATILAMIVGGVLRFAAIDYHSFWYDEAVGDQLTAHGSYFDIALGRARDNGLPPLHYLTDKFSSGILGTDEAGHRTFPAIFGIATILFTGILGRKLHSANVGIVAAWLVAISPFQIEISNESRVYSFVHMMTTLDAILLLRWISSRSWSDGLTYTLGTAVLCYSHYFVVFVLLGHLVFLLTHTDRWRLLARWGGFMSVVAILWLPWVPAFLDQLGTPGNLSRYGNSWKAQFAATPVVYSVGRTFGWRESGTLVLGLAAVVAFLGYIVPALLGILRPQPNARVSVPLLASWVALPILIPLVAAFSWTPMYHHRYASVGFIGFLIMVAIGLVGMRRPYRAFAVFIILLSTTYSLWNYFTIPLKDDWRSATPAILDHHDSDHIILTDTDIEVVPLHYYTRRANVELAELYGLVIEANRDALTAVRHQNGVRLDERPKDYTDRILSARSVTLALCVPVRSPDSYQEQFERRGFRTTRIDRFHRITVLHFEKVVATGAATLPSGETPS